MSTAASLMTADELLRLDREGHRHELIRGQLKEVTLPGYRHGRIAMRIAFSLERQVRRRKLGSVSAAETGFKLESNPDTVRGADVAFVAKKRVASRDPDGHFPGAPDLAVEVMSPSDSSAKAAEKAAFWLRFGARAVVVVDPKALSVVVFRVEGRTSVDAEGTLTVPDVVPGWKLPVSEIFAD